MNDDESPTPKQSGSYGIMQGICEDSFRSLDKILGELSLKVEIGRLGPNGEAFFVGNAFLATFEKLSKQVESWATTTPTAEAKTATIQKILETRTAASDWAKSLGYTL